MASCVCVYILQHTATQCSTYSTLKRTGAHCNTMQRICSTLQHLQYTKVQCSALERTGAHCSTLQHTTAHIEDSRRGARLKENGGCLLVRCICNNMLHHSATTCCSTLQHTEDSRGGLEENSPYSTLCLQQHAVPHCNSIAATNCNTLQRAEDFRRGSRREWLLYWLQGKPESASNEVLPRAKDRRHTPLQISPMPRQTPTCHHGCCRGNRTWRPKCLSPVFH
mmetsp:Transcript_2866/g.2513  ORF Transcript_2866/g.2513 Transcript_2866/m.2513 type:complete len:223 (-) Transcript_2866:514-1182(-)